MAKDNSIEIVVDRELLIKALGSTGFNNFAFQKQSTMPDGSTCIETIELDTTRGGYPKLKIKVEYKKKECDSTPTTL